ncbi:glycosyltransferase family 2 protein [Corynebacterium phoceense]|uniref:glycosyltransferase family 2 protein n=1 Tax=Corynebacterium phoceense TaxID=1686286 RepID=UPI00211C846E|nr:glycosyltransferase family 2 protein [Corynebacterium phoceense]MCQ9335072.1 glycosyltransferase family 2 protein [Corynebacterium phoceense]
MGPIISIIVPLYNVEDYVIECLESIRDQSNIAKDQIEVLLIDDGSTDGTLPLVRDFISSHEGMTWRLEEITHRGVSAARNFGLGKAAGDWFAFIDGDDVIPSNYLSEALAFISDNEINTGLFCAPIEFFRAQQGMHPLNRNLSRTNFIVNVDDEPKRIRVHIPGCFVSAALWSRLSLSFDEEVSFSEDKLLVASILMSERSYGLMGRTSYQFRKRTNDSPSKSTIQGAPESPLWYLNTLLRVDSLIVEKALRDYGEIPKFVEYLLAYDLQWRLQLDNQSVISKSQENAYIALIAFLLQIVSDDVILGMASAPVEYRVFALRLKYGTTFEESTSIVKDSVFLGDNLLWRFTEDNSIFYVENVSFTDGCLTVEGFAGGLKLPGVRYALEFAGKYIPCLEAKKSDHLKRFLGLEVWDKNSYSAEVKIDGIEPIAPVIMIGNKTSVKARFVLTKHSRNQIESLSDDNPGVLGAVLRNTFGIPSPIS